MKQVAVVPAMGTMVSLEVRTPTRPEVFGEAVESVTRRLHEIDEVFSPWRRDSWVSGLIVPNANVCPSTVTLTAGASRSKRLSSVAGICSLLVAASKSRTRWTCV